MPRVGEKNVVWKDLSVVWMASAVLACFVLEVATLCCNRRARDHSTKEFTLVCSLVLGPVFLLIAAELLLLAAIGNGLTTNRTRRYKDS